MAAWSSLLDGFSAAISPYNLLFALIGCIAGTLVGVLPGLGPTAAIAMLLPLLGIRDSRVYLTALLIAIGYGAIDELGQIPIPGRNADAVDWLADVAGAVAGVMCYRLMVGAMACQPFGFREQKKPSPP